MDHGGERPYPCPECPFTCKTKQQLNEHRRKHSVSDFETAFLSLSISLSVYLSLSLSFCRVLLISFLLPLSFNFFPFISLFLSVFFYLSSVYLPLFISFYLPPSTFNLKSLPSSFCFSPPFSLTDSNSTSPLSLPWLKLQPITYHAVTCIHENDFNIFENEISMTRIRIRTSYTRIRSLRSGFISSSQNWHDILKRW